MTDTEAKTRSGADEGRGSTPSAPRKLVTLAVPVLNEEAVVDVFLERVRAVVDPLPYDFEFLFVDDGSTDGTLKRLTELNRVDPRVRAVSLSRNFGKEMALAAAFHEARGDAVVPMDADLQDPPELLPAFLKHWEEGYDSVVGVRADRHTDTRFKRGSASLFYKWFNRVSRYHMVDNAGDFRLLDRKCVDALNALSERVRFTKAMYAWVGFRIFTVEYSRPERAAGTTKWNAWKLWNFALDGITSFSSLPLRVWSYLGGFVALAGFAYAFVLITRTLLFGRDVPGWASLMVMVLTLGGLILLSLGIVGEYLGRIFEEVKARPLYVVRERVGFGEMPEAGGDAPSRAPSSPSNAF